MNPLVSICIPTYNGAQFIAEALNSALAQTYTNIEIVVSDDASTDNTLQIVKTYQDKTSIPIRVYRHQPNGIGSNWNQCMKQAQGDYIKFLFQDDVLMPTCVERMVEVLQHDNKIGLVSCKREFIIEAGMDSPDMVKWIQTYGDLQSGFLSNNNSILILNKTVFKRKDFYASPLNKIGEPSVVMFRSRIIDKVGWFSEDLEQILDYEYWYRILKRYHIAIIQEPLVKFRLHQAQATHVNKNKNINDYSIYQKILYKQYFWLLNKTEKLKVLRSKYAFIDYLFKVKGKILVKFKSYFH